MRRAQAVRGGPAAGQGTCGGDSEGGSSGSSGSSRRKDSSGGWSQWRGSRVLLPPRTMTECAHCGKRAAGDLSDTPYRRKRRALRDHRAEMRITRELIDEHGLLEDLEARIEEETGEPGVSLGHDPDLDADTDNEDPADLDLEDPDLVVATASAAADQHALVEAIGRAKEHYEHTLEVERLRMRLEDQR